MSGYVYFIRGSHDRIKIDYSQNPARRFRWHATRTRTIGKLTFVGCVAGTLADEKAALSRFPRIGRQREIRRGQISISDIFSQIVLSSTWNHLRFRVKIRSSASPNEVHEALVEVSARTGVKIKVLVEKALRKAYPVKNGFKRAEARAK